MTKIYSSTWWKWENRRRWWRNWNVSQVNFAYYIFWSFLTGYFEKFWSMHSSNHLLYFQAHWKSILVQDRTRYRTVWRRNYYAWNRSIITRRFPPWRRKLRNFRWKKFSFPIIRTSKPFIFSFFFEREFKIFYFLEIFFTFIRNRSISPIGQDWTRGT